MLPFYIVICGYEFTPGTTPGMIWMTKAHGEDEGEGQEVPELALKEALDKFYSDNF